MVVEEKAFCPHCLDFKTYTVQSRIGFHKHPQTEETIYSDDWYAICDECNKEIFVEYIGQRNIDEFVYMCGAHDFLEKIKEQNAAYDEELGCDVVYITTQELDKYLKEFVEERL